MAQSQAYESKEAAKKRISSGADQRCRRGAGRPHPRHHIARAAPTPRAGWHIWSVGPT
ncbi:hypothetical protein ACFU44_20700 [Nocardia rhizosphaerihabitans]|uniref:hypothetical protein n=1 Tax=Nocardia rhizosphaerihabitans TaxID=1691570 RepID=UPI00366BFF2E